MSKLEREPGQLDCLVIPDLHGELELGKRAVGLAEKLGVDAIFFLGDLIGRKGPDVKGTVELAKSTGDTVRGNHEQFFLNILMAAKSGFLINPGGRKYLRQMMRSYDVARERKLSDAAQNLTQAMAEEGHLAWMENLPPFCETSELVMVHAGPRLDEPWQAQRKKIKKEAKITGKASSAPIQICDSNHELSGARPVPETVDSRTFVTGHRHSGVGPDKRTTTRRVFLTSRIHKNNPDPLYVWESRTGRIHTIEAV